MSLRRPFERGAERECHGETGEHSRFSLRTVRAIIDLEPGFKVKRDAEMLTIGALARRMGLKPSAVRYYERQGLISPARQANGYRVYGPEAASALSFICRAKALGFSLDQIGEILEIRRRDAEPCKRVRNLIERNLMDVDRKVGELSRLRRELKALGAKTIPSSASGRVCPIIESGE